MSKSPAGNKPHPFETWNIPGCTYSRPQIASVGLTEAKAKEAGHKVKVGKLDVDESPITAGKFGVRGVPTIMVFRDGQRAAQHVGLTTKQKLLDLVNG